MLDRLNQSNLGWGLGICFFKGCDFYFTLTLLSKSRMSKWRMVVHGSLKNVKSPGLKLQDWERRRAHSGLVLGMDLHHAKAGDA